MKRLLFLLLTAALLLAGCAAEVPDPTPQAPTAATPQAGPLDISVTRLWDAPLVQFTPEELSGSYSMAYHNVTDVQISIDGEPYPLEQAIKDGLVTIEALVAQAQFDAAKGDCKESFTSTNGLTRFIYTYRDFELVVYDDVYESPSAEPHLFREFIVSTPRNSEGVSVSPFITDENGERIDIGREDWGITLEATDVTADGLTLNITQSGGQQVGTLNVVYFWLSEKAGDDEESIHYDPDEWGWTSDKIPIASNSSTSLDIEWASYIGSLSPGTYILQIMILDIYDPTQVHPLQRNFRDNQVYVIEFILA